MDPEALLSSRCDGLTKSDFTVNCLTFFLPHKHELGDKRLRKRLILRKLYTSPLLCEDLAALAYYNDGYFQCAPPKLSFRAGPQPKRPDVLRLLESKPVGFCFEAEVLLDYNYKLDSAEVGWPCYVVSDLKELAEPDKLIAQPYRSSAERAAHSRRGLQIESLLSPSPKRHRVNASAPGSESSRVDISRPQHLPPDSPANSDKHARSDRQVWSEQNDGDDAIQMLKQEIQALKQQATARREIDEGLASIELGYERLLRSAYNEWRNEIRDVEERAATILQSYSEEISELKARLEKLERRQR